MYMERLFCFTYQTQLDLQRGDMYLMTMYREIGDVTGPYLRTYYENRDISLTNAI